MLGNIQTIQASKYNNVMQKNNKWKLFKVQGNKQFKVPAPLSSIVMNFKIKQKLNKDILRLITITLM